MAVGAAPLIGAPSETGGAAGETEPTGETSDAGGPTDEGTGEGPDTAAMVLPWADTPDSSPLTDAPPAWGPGKEAPVASGEEAASGRMVSAISIARD